MNSEERQKMGETQCSYEQETSNHRVSPTQSSTAEQEAKKQSGKGQDDCFHIGGVSKVLACSLSRLPDDLDKVSSCSEQQQRH
jgi:hypothetical protein